MFCTTPTFIHNFFPFWQPVLLHFGSVILVCFHGTAEVFKVGEGEEKVDHVFIELLIQIAVLRKTTYETLYLFVYESLICELFVNDFIKHSDILFIHIFVFVVIFLLIFLKKVLVIAEEFAEGALDFW